MKQSLTSCWSGIGRAFPCQHPEQRGIPVEKRNVGVQHVSSGRLLQLDDALPRVNEKKNCLKFQLQYSPPRANQKRLQYTSMNQPGPHLRQTSTTQLADSPRESDRSSPAHGNCNGRSEKMQQTNCRAVLTPTWHIFATLR